MVLHKLIKLEEVQCLVPFQRVSCEVKVVDVDSVMKFLVKRRSKMFWWEIVLEWQG